MLLEFIIISKNLKKLSITSPNNHKSVYDTQNMITLEKAY
jgi:hypothetical protein